MADPFPPNPFRPGAGRQPAHMGHRPEIEQPLLNILASLRGGEPDVHLAYLYGPRGNGKTVLLSWLDEQAHRECEGLPIAHVRLLPEHLESPELLCRRVVGSLRGTPRLLDLVTVDVEAGIPGLFRAKVGPIGRNDPIPGLSDWLERDRHPVLFTVDEAQEADPEVLGRFLNAVQLAGQHRPIAAVLAGTPGLQDTLRDSRASFWNRGLRLPVGLLPDAEAQAVLARPFLDANLEADDDAVIELARTAEDYPYFLQLYGAAAWDTTEKSGARCLLRDHVPEAIRATNASRRRYYGDRYDEFFKANALPLARDIALAFRSSKNGMTNAAVNGLLARHAGDPAEMRSMLNAKGFIWRDTEDRWALGIPSLMDYMIEETEPGPAP